MPPVKSAAETMSRSIAWGDLAARDLARRGIRSHDLVARTVVEGDDEVEPVVLSRVSARISASSAAIPGVRSARSPITVMWTFSVGVRKGRGG